jgi:hypothetical protein
VRPPVTRTICDRDTLDAREAVEIANLFAIVIAEPPIVCRIAQDFAQPHVIAVREGVLV